MPEKIKLKDVRLSFPSLDKAKDFQGNQDYQYSATFLIKKGSPEQKIVEDAIEKMAAEAWPKTFKKEIASLKAAGSLKCCWTDGDESGKDGYEGCMSLVAKRKKADGPPLVANRAGEAVAAGNAEFPYGGAYVVASVEIYMQNHPTYGKGIRCGLRGAQFFKDGESFGGAAPVGEDEFESLADEFAELL